jgi:hypothetical protein
MLRGRDATFEHPPHPREVRDGEVSTKKEDFSNAQPSRKSLPSDWSVSAEEEIGVSESI